MYLNIIKAHMTNPQLILTDDILKVIPLISEDKDTHCQHFCSTSYWKSWPEQLSKKKK